jgi:GTP-binding protein
MADIPGLIKGAHSGSGLGTRFLRHIERTYILVHLIDISPASGREPLSDFDIINDELNLYSPSMVNKPQVIALNKIDLVMESERVDLLISIFQKKGYKVFPISAKTGEGTGDLINYLFELLSISRGEKRGALLS